MSDSSRTQIFNASAAFEHRLTRSLKKRLGLFAVVAALATGAHASLAATVPSTSASVTYHRAQVDGVGVFYREAGPRDAPTIVLLHGFPSSSRQYATLMPLLAVRYHVIAPDYPGFGESDAPPPSQYTYTFDHLAQTTTALLAQLKIDRYVLFVQDYGAPIGFRMMVDHPERLRGLVVQNGNMYVEGLGKKWTAIEQYWADRSAHPEVLDAFLSFDSTKVRHIANSPNPERYDPEAWLTEYAFLTKPGEREIQAELLYDYRTNVASYPKWQQWLRDHQPPTLVVWGGYDPSFISPGAQAYKRDLPKAEIHVYDAGHFALEEKLDEIASVTLEYLDRLPE